MLIIRLPRFSILLFLPAFLCTHAAAFAESAPQVSAASCIVMYEDGRALYEKNADTRSLIASTTKLMTALVCLERLPLDEGVTIKPDCCEVEGSSMGLRAGERYTVRELLLGLLLASGNDAALALADHVSGGMQAFAALMNRKAEELDLTRTHFANPHGLDAPEHYSTARDLAKLMLACMENDAFCGLIGTKSAELGGVVILNHNRLLLTCPGCIGGKTGYTAAAGRCLVSCCERGGMRLLCVTLNDPHDWRDHRMLYDWAYAGYRLYDPTKELHLEVPLVTAGRRAVSVMPQQGRALLLPADETVTLEIELPKFVFAPVKKGETAGEIRVIIRQRTEAVYPLVYAQDAKLAVAF